MSTDDLAADSRRLWYMSSVIYARYPIEGERNFHPRQCRQRIIAFGQTMKTPLLTNANRGGVVFR